MPFVRCVVPQEPLQAAVQEANKMRHLFCLTVEATGSDARPELPPISEFDPGWWNTQMVVHPKFASGRVQEAARERVRQAAHCAALRGHCLGCDNPRYFETGAKYVDRAYLKMPDPIPCPATLDALKKAMVCPVPSSAVNMVDEES